MTFYLNGEIINVLNAPAITETLDETLDSGSLTLVASDLEEEIKPDSELLIVDDELNAIPLIVSADNVEIFSKKPLSYEHSLTVVQNSRKFSKTQIRNTVFAQPAKPILYCYYNATLNNDSQTSNMTFLTDYGLTYFSNAITIPQKYRIKRAFVLFQLMEMYGTKNTTAVSKQININLPSISFDLYNNGIYVTSYTFTNIANNSIFEIDKSILGSNSSYDIRNVVVQKTTLETTGDFDYYVVNIKFNLDTYIYTMYDVLDILKKQIAKNEYEEITSVVAPSIVITKTYIPSSSNYQVSFTLKNNNVQTATITYQAFGSLPTSGSISLAGGATSDNIVLGAISSGNGYINAYATISNVDSTTTTEAYTMYGVSAPILNWLYNSTYGYQYEFVNTNSIGGTLYYKVYVEGSTVENYSTQAISANGGTFTSVGYFNNSRMIYDYYFISTDSRQSETITGSIVLGTLYTLVNPTFIGDIGVTKGATTYTLTATINNSNNVDCVLHTKSANTSYTTQTIFANSSVVVTKSELISSGSNGYIYAYLSGNNYYDSLSKSKYWSYLLTLDTPIITINSVTQNGSIYSVNFNVQNTNSVACSVYANAQSSTSTIPQSILGSVNANSVATFIISTSLYNAYIVSKLSATNYSDSANGYHAYTYTNAPSTSSVLVNVVMEEVTQNEYRSNVHIVNHSSYNLMGTMSDFEIHGIADSGTQTISSLNVNSSFNLYGSQSHSTPENGEQWSLTLNLTDGNDTWVLNYNGEFGIQTLTPPSVVINSVTLNGLVYNVNFRVTNSNNVSCDVYANAQSSTTNIPQTLIGTLNANSSSNFTISTSLNNAYIVSKLSSANYISSNNGYDSYSYVVAPSTTSIPVTVIMENDGQGGYRANVYITNNSTYNLSGTMSDFYINIELQRATQTISSLNVNDTINLYGTVAHQSMEHSQDWYVTLNLTDGTNNWVLNYDGYLA